MPTVTNTDVEQGEETAGRGTSALLFVIAFLLFCVGLLRGHELSMVNGVLQAGMNEPITCSIYVFALALIVAVLRGRSRALDVHAEDSPLCTHCLRPFRQGVHFCPRCSAPLTVFATTADYESVYAQMWAIGKALKYPRRALQVVGVAVLTGPTLVGFPLMLVLGLSQERDFFAIETFAFMGAVFYAYALVMLYCWRNWRRYRRDPDSVPPDSEYGSPPWWTYDRWWTLPADEADGEAEDADHNAGEADDTVAHPED
jgi:hypothetical protein